VVTQTCSGAKPVTGIGTLIRTGERVFRCVRVYRQEDISISQ